MALKLAAAAFLVAFGGALCAQPNTTPAVPQAQEDAPPPPVAPSASAESEARASDHRAAPQPPIGVPGTGAAVTSGRVEVVPNECLALERRARERCMQRYSPTSSGSSAPQE